MAKNDPLFPGWLLATISAFIIGDRILEQNRSAVLCKFYKQCLSNKTSYGIRRELSGPINFLHKIDF